MFSSTRLNLVIPFVFRSSLRIEMYQLHQLHCQFIFDKTCSDKESSDGFTFEDFKYDGAEDWEKAVSLETPRF